jgi:DNA-binding NarL/FixJ family response regulator
MGLHRIWAIMKIIIADDHALLRKGLRDTLEQLGPAVTVVEAEDHDTARARLLEHPDADLAVIDLRMPGMNGAASLSGLGSAAATVPLVILSASESPEEMQDALDHGAVGYIPKSESPAVILNALRLVLSGGMYIPPALLKSMRDARPAAHATAEKLTPRQRDVLQLLVQGKSNKEIARRFELTEATVKAHVTAIFKCLGVSSRAQATRLIERLAVPGPERRR